MPVYVFECELCGEIFERESHMNDDLSQVICPNGHPTAHRVYSAPAVIYKGSGFYVNDKRAKASKPSRD